MADRRPVLFRNGTLLTMDDAHTVIQGGDVLVVDDKIAEVGTGLAAPDGALEVDATGGIVLPGMIDTHRHMWQTAMRAYGADWTLTQYFVWYYLEHGRLFRPEDIHAGNVVSAWDALESGVTTTVDWSHGLQTVDHADAAVDALQSVPGRFVLAYGNIQAAPWEWTAEPAVKAFFDRRRGDGDMLGFQIAFDVLGEESFPEGPAFAFARARTAAHHARGCLGRDQRQRHPADARERLHGSGQHLRARRHPDPGLLPADRGERRLGLGVHGVRAERRPGVPAHLAGTPPRHPGLAVPRHQRVVEQRPVHRHAYDARRGPLARAPRGTCRRRHGHQLLVAGRAGRRVGDPGWRAGARAGRPRRAEPRQEGRRRAHQERRLGVLLPVAQPLRPRGLPGPAWRRAHGGGRRPCREERGQARRRRPGRRPDGGREHGRLPQGRDGRGRLAVRHEPRAAEPGRARQPLPVHRLQVRLHPRGPRHDLRRAGVGRDG